MVGAGAAVVVAVLLWLDWLPIGVPGQWVWMRRAVVVVPGPGLVVALGIVVGASVVVLAVLRSDRQLTRTIATLLLVVIFAASIIATVGLAASDPGFWASGALAVISDTSMGYYGQALSLSGVSDAFFYHSARVASSRLPDRVRTHPPGPIIFFYLLRQWLECVPGVINWSETALAQRDISPPQFYEIACGLTEAPITRRDAALALPIAFILTVLGALVVLPIYGIAAIAFDRRTGLTAALLAGTVPSLLHFVPSIDGVGAALALTYLWLWMLAVRRAEVWLYILAALGATVMLLWSFGYVMLLLLAVIVAVPVWGQVYPDKLSRHLRGVAWGILVFAAVYQLLSSGLEYNILTAFPASVAVHRQILIATGRSYWLWLPMNLYDFLLFMGPALAVMSVAAIYNGLKQRRWPALPQGLVIGLLIIIALLLLSGSTRGEVGRIWVFLMPLAVLPVAYYVARLSDSRFVWVGASLTGLQVCFAIVLHATLVPVYPF